MATPRKSVDMATGKIGRQKRINRKRQEEKLKLPRGDLETTPPAWLVPEAAEEYRRVVREAGEIGMLDNLDFSVLGVYAAAFAQFCEAHRHMATDGYVITNDRGTEIPSPWVGVADKASNQIMKCSSKLGLAVMDRLKLVVPESDAVMENPVDKWLKFLPASSGKRGGKVKANA